jgi:hypothetical protein
VLFVAIVVLATAAPAGAKPQTLHLHFQRVVTGVGGHCGSAVVTSGPFMLASLAKPGPQACASRFLLIDDRTGKRTVLRPGGYTTVVSFGAPWILFDHNLRFELYNIATKRWRPLGCDGGCQPDGTFAYALGTNWLEFIVEGHQDCGDGIHFECGPETYAFYNLRTHRVRHGLPQTSTRIDDLDWPTLVRKLCSPLRVPKDGSLTLERRVGVLTSRTGSFLERCGSQGHMPIDVHASDAPGGLLLTSSSTVLWQLLTPVGFWTGPINGVWLPSLRRFTALLPSSIDPTAALPVLDARRLYVVDGHGVLWGASLSR